MVSKAVILLTIAFLIQGYNCKTNDEIINDAHPKIVKLEREIVAELKDAKKGIDQTRGLVQKSVGNAEKELHHNAKEIRELAKQSEVDAKTNNRDIKTCLNSLDVAINALNFHDVGKCAQHLDDLHRVHNHLEHLGHLKHDVSDLIHSCEEKKPATVDQLQMCIDNELKADRKQLDKLSKQINKDLKRITNESLKCIETNLNRLNLGLEKAKNDFKTCASAH